MPMQQAPQTMAHNVALGMNTHVSTTLASAVTPSQVHRGSNIVTAHNDNV